MCFKISLYTKEEQKYPQKMCCFEQACIRNEIFSVLPAIPTYAFKPLVHLVKTTDHQLLNAVSNCG